jgi:cyclopropane fatty-acyl-phospholipid synthase-like methyltransferase
MKQSQTLDVAYFDSLYDGAPDPWGFADSPYEAAKYSHTIEALGCERASSALEVGCSIGVLTRRLAERCDGLLATDLAKAPLQAARQRCADLPHVTFRQVREPADSFAGSYDLIVLSEVVYYWDDRDLARGAAAMDRALRPEGRVLLVHWIGETNYPKSADEAVDGLRRLLRDMDIETAERREKYRLDLWRRRRTAAAF